MEGPAPGFRTILLNIPATGIHLLLETVTKKVKMEESKRQEISAGTYDLRLLQPL